MVESYLNVFSFYIFSVRIGCEISGFPGYSPSELCHRSFSHGEASNRKTWKITDIRNVCDIRSTSCLINGQTWKTASIHTCT